MQRIKIFKSIESELSVLESEVNAWIEKEHPRIITITGNIAPQTGNPQQAGSFSASDVLMIVLYEVGNGTAE